MTLFREGSDHFLRGEFFHENYQNIFSKKISFLVERNLEIKNPREIQNIMKISWNFDAPCRFLKKQAFGKGRK